MKRLILILLLIPLVSAYNVSIIIIPSNNIMEGIVTTATGFCPPETVCHLYLDNQMVLNPDIRMLPEGSYNYTLKSSYFNISKEILVHGKSDIIYNTTIETLISTIINNTNETAKSLVLEECNVKSTSNIRNCFLNISNMITYSKTNFFIFLLILGIILYVLDYAGIGFGALYNMLRYHQPIRPRISRRFRV